MIRTSAIAAARRVGVQPAASSWAASVRVRLQLPWPVVVSSSPAPQPEPLHFRWFTTTVKPRSGRVLLERLRHGRPVPVDVGAARIDERLRVEDGVAAHRRDAGRS